MGINASNTFILRVEYRYIVRKSKKSLDVDEPTFHAKKTACYRLQQQTKVQSADFTEHCIIRLLSV